MNSIDYKAMRLELYDAWTKACKEMDCTKIVQARERIAQFMDDPLVPDELKDYFRKFVWREQLLMMGTLAERYLERNKNNGN